MGAAGQGRRAGHLLACSCEAGFAHAQLACVTCPLRCATIPSCLILHDSYWPCLERSHLPPHLPPTPAQHLTEMEEEDGRHEGCHITGTMLVKRVAGRIHLSVHQNMIFQLIPQVRPATVMKQGL